MCNRQPTKAYHTQDGVTSYLMRGHHRYYVSKHGRRSVLAPRTIKTWQRALEWGRRYFEENSDE